MLDGNVRILFGNLLYYRPPQTGALKHVRLIDRSQLLSAGLCRLKSFVCDAFYFKLRIDHRIEGRIAIVFIAAFAEVYVTGELAEKQNVSTTQNFRSDA